MPGKTPAEPLWTWVVAIRCDVPPLCNIGGLIIARITSNGTSRRQQQYISFMKQHDSSSARTLKLRLKRSAANTFLFLTGYGWSVMRLGLIQISFRSAASAGHRAFATAFVFVVNVTEHEKRRTFISPCISERLLHLCLWASLSHPATGYTLHCMPDFQRIGGTDQDV